MSIFSKLSKKKEEQVEAVQARVEEYITFIRVYYQAVMVVNLGITNINAAPDMAMFKRMFKIQTLNGRLGLAEKSRARKILMQQYGLSEQFFKEVDASIKSNCKQQADLQSYLYTFQGFSNDLIMLVSKQMQFKLIVPPFFKKIIYILTEKTIHSIVTKKDWKADDVRKTCRDIQKYKEKLNYSEQWMTEFVYPILLMAKNSKSTKK